ncbi:MAG: hypothetical protein P8Y97_20115, partial [Candidatus Lokiarchaeota archaeon]
VEIKEDFRIKDHFGFFRLGHTLDLENNVEDENLKKAIKDLKSIKNNQGNSNFYLLRIKVVGLTQKEIEHPVTILSQLIDPEIGIGISPSNICEDIINIFSLYFGGWFKMVSNFLFWENTNLLALIKKEFRDIPETMVGSDLNQNYDSITSLREEQFYLIQKSLSRFNQSLKSVDNDLELGLVLLVSTTENLSQKYGDPEEELDENDEFYIKLKKIIDNLPKNIDKIQRNNLFSDIIQAYMSLTYLKIKAKYKNFCLNSISPYFYNEKFEEMIDNLYNLRSKILHAGEILGYALRDQIIVYNPRNKSGRIKTYEGEKGRHLVIIRIPSYNELLKIFANIILNFIRYLYSVKDSEEDKVLYKESDARKRNMVVGSINRDGFKPGNVVNLNTDFYRRIDFIDLTQIKIKLKIIELNQNNESLEESLNKIDDILNYSNFNTKFLVFRRACYFKIIFLHNLGRYDECLGMFEKYAINEISEETCGGFQYKSILLC